MVITLLCLVLVILFHTSFSKLVSTNSVSGNNFLLYLTETTESWEKLPHTFTEPMCSAFSPVIVYRSFMLLIQYLEILPHISLLEVLKRREITLDPYWVFLISRIPGCLSQQISSEYSQAGILDKNRASVSTLSPETRGTGMAEKIGELMLTRF